MRSILFYAAISSGLALAVSARAAEPTVTDKERVLAKLLSGQCVDNAYFTKEDCSRLNFMQFGCGAVISDCPFSDQLGDADRLEVKRTFYNFSGGVSHTEVVVITPDQFWGLVHQVEELLDKKLTLPKMMMEPVEMAEKQGGRD